MLHVSVTATHGGFVENGWFQHADEVVGGGVARQRPPARGRVGAPAVCHGGAGRATCAIPQLGQNNEHTCPSRRRPVTFALRVSVRAAWRLCVRQSDGEALSNEGRLVRRTPAVVSHLTYLSVSGRLRREAQASFAFGADGVGLLMGRKDLSVVQTPTQIKAF